MDITTEKLDELERLFKAAGAENWRHSGNTNDQWVENVAAPPWEQEVFEAQTEGVAEIVGLMCELMPALIQAARKQIEMANGEPARDEFGYFASVGDLIKALSKFDSGEQLYVYRVDDHDGVADVVFIDWQQPNYIAGGYSQLRGVVIR
jgi:hypothetical protein